MKPDVLDPRHPASPTTPGLRSRLESRQQLASPEPPPVKTPAPREFSAGDKALIKRVQGLMPLSQLLHVLNERLIADRGSDVELFTLEQLHREIGGAGAPASGTPPDWANLRLLLAAARKEGVLKAIDEQVIDDFAVVWSLNSKQLLVLKDIVLGAKEGLS